jgi:hypothetical protein
MWCLAQPLFSLLIESFLLEIEKACLKTTIPSLEGSNEEKTEPKELKGGFFRSQRFIQTRNPSLT